MNIHRYTSSDKPIWDAFVRASKNGTFLFERDYMDYHRDRFFDHSLMFLDDKGRLVALLPANEVEIDGVRHLYSHQGLTYGGFVLSTKNTVEQVMELFDETVSYLEAEGFETFHYKQMPTIYHQCPSQEDEYALWRHGATLEGCNISCTVPLAGTPQQPPFERRRRRGVVRAEEAGYQIVENASLEVFWPIMVNNLQERYDASPVHALAEMQLLQDSFPQNIQCFLCVDSMGEAQAGAVVFLTNPMTIHVQYGHATSQGKADGALDFLYTRLMERYRNQGFQYFDFGTSNEQGGRVLNASLIAQKEGFGGRGIAYKTFVIQLYRPHSFYSFNSL